MASARRSATFSITFRIREAVGLPVMLYNVPGTSGIDLTPEEVQQLAEEGTVQSVKWSTGEVSRIRDTKFLCVRRFQCL